MGDRSRIEWTEATWNPVTGCDRISAGCDNCYALALSKRLKAMGAEKYQTDGDPRTSGPGFGVMTHPSALSQPLQWRTPRVVFVNSMSDLFHARVDLPFIQSVFGVIRGTPQHTYQILTKRPMRARRLADRLEWPQNLWLGTSIEDMNVADRVDEVAVGGARAGGWEDPRLVTRMQKSGHLAPPLSPLKFVSRYRTCLSAY